MRLEKVEERMTIDGRVELEWGGKIKSQPTRSGFRSERGPGSSLKQVGFAWSDLYTSIVFTVFQTPSAWTVSDMKSTWSVHSNRHA